MTAYYNENDPKAAAWLRELIRCGHIASGDVDERSITDVKPIDLIGYSQCHFFAGIGGWSYALRCAGWSDDRPVWTGSCPCQPFSDAGEGEGFADERHLWPYFHWLIDQCRPDEVFGEQVASKDGLAWLDLVYADLEGSGYASGALDFCSAGIGAPHIRQRLYWFGQKEGLEHDASQRRQQRQAEPGERGAIGGRSLDGVADSSGGQFSHPKRRAQGRDGTATGRRLVESAGLANSDGGDASAERQQRSGEQRQQPPDYGTLRLDDDDDERLERQRGGPETAPGRDGAIRPIAEAGELGGLAYAAHQQHDGAGFGRPSGRIKHSDSGGTVEQSATGPVDGFWRNVDWLFCRDGRWRPVEPGTFPLANGFPARVGLLRGYGNAINVEAATAFVEAYLETEEDAARHFRMIEMYDLTNDKEGIFG